ncbi:hypothetical protein TNCV_534421 [Trichonephila clavipes]|nr:hypothetical protein TNCV_534421 [Trichonephila clavipes]
MSPHAANDVGGAEYHQESAFAPSCMNQVTCWRTALAMSSRVANRLPRIGSLILGMRSKSQGEFLPWRTAILFVRHCF